jgi:hypothetical protein
MSIIGQQIAEAKIRNRYRDRATEEQLSECKDGKHISEDHYWNDSCDFTKNLWPRRCKTCGVYLFPATWEPVEPVESDCEHETIGYCEDGDHKTSNRFPQKCKKCGIELKPKTWKPFKDIKENA